MADELARLELEKKQNGNIKIAFNEYNNDFAIKKGMITSEFINEEYALEYAYEGKYFLHLKFGNEQIEEVMFNNKINFSGLEAGR